MARPAPATDEPPHAVFVSDAASIEDTLVRCVGAGYPDLTLVSVGDGSSAGPRASAGHIQLRDVNAPDTSGLPARVRHVAADPDTLVELIRSTTMLRPPGTDDPGLLDGVLERVFSGEPERFWRFMAALQGALPPGSGVAFRGSAVEGENYRTGQAFDAAGPGTSDVDLVLLGEAVMAAWQPEAFYLVGVNTWPLDDDRPWIAPALDPVRTELQALIGRPLAIQAMARWFLDVRSAVQGTRYVLVDG